MAELESQPLSDKGRAELEELRAGKARREEQEKARREREELVALRAERAKADEAAAKAAGAEGVIRPAKNACQVVIKGDVQAVYDALRKQL